ncbi:MAG: flagellar motor switch phosphatase FliY, partial [Dethiobacteria bacterium]|nr:flagellar motor switch phosphatase FliY [Dethiobacteria bacterium]
SFEGKEGPLNEIEQSAVQEAMNQMMGAMATSMAELFQRPIDISPPQVKTCNLAGDSIIFDGYGEEQQFVRVEFSMKIEDIINSVMVQVIPVEFARNMAAHLLGDYSETAPGSEEIDTAGAGAVAEVTAVDLANVDSASPIETFISSGADENDEYGLSELEKDTIAEVGNISLGSSATTLSAILNKAVEITTPKLNVIQIKDIQEKYPIPCVMVDVEYTVGLQGSNMLLVKKADAMIIASLMMGEEPHEDKDATLSEIEMSAVQEAMNQMMGSMATSMSDLFQRPIDISPPRMELIDLGDERLMLSNLDPEEYVVHVEFNIKVEDIIDSVMFQVIQLDFARTMAGYLLGGAMDSAPETDAADERFQFVEAASEVKGDKELEKDRGYFEEPARQSALAPAASMMPLTVDLQKIELVKDIPMDVTVILGSARVALGKLFALGRGGIVDLDCSANDPVEIMANDRLLAKGEIVMVNDQLGVRITEIQFEEVIESYGI